jgi:hypothetical protein
MPMIEFGRIDRLYVEEGIAMNCKSMRDFSGGMITTDPDLWDNPNYGVTILKNEEKDILVCERTDPKRGKVIYAVQGFVDSLYINIEVSLLGTGGYTNEINVYPIYVENINDWGSRRSVNKRIKKFHENREDPIGEYKRKIFFQHFP